MLEQSVRPTPQSEGKTYRFLLACWPFPGHIRPFLSLAQALQRAGHQVAIYTGNTVREMVEQEGFTFFPFQQVSEEQAYASIALIDSVPQGGRPGSRLILRTFRDWLVETIPQQVEDLQPIIDGWQPDVIVTETAMWGPMLVLWETSRIPVAIQSTLLCCLVPGADAPPAGLGMSPPRGLRDQLVQRLLTGTGWLLGVGLRRRMDAIRFGYDLPPLGCTVNVFSGRLPLYLIGSIRELDYNRQDLPPSVHYVGPYGWDRSLSEEVPSWLAELPADRPWVHVTESTLRYGDPFLLRAAVQGLGGQPIEVILTTGQQREPKDLPLGPLAANIHLAQWVSHNALLPRCSAMVSTGGAGTVMAALRAGVPQVVVPTTWDKPDNAQRVVEAGAGVRLAPRECTPERLRAAVAEVLETPHYRERAQYLAHRLAEAPGARGAAELLQAVAASRRPTG